MEHHVHLPAQSGIIAAKVDKLSRAGFELHRPTCGHCTYSVMEIIVDRDARVASSPGRCHRKSDPVS